MATTLTERLLANYFPTLAPDALAGRTILELSLTGSTDPLSLVLVRSTFSSWATDPLFDRFVSGASSTGLAALQDAASTRPWRPIYFGGSAVLAPASVFANAAMNQIGGGTIYERFRALKPSDFFVDALKLGQMSSLDNINDNMDLAASNPILQHLGKLLDGLGLRGRSAVKQFLDPQYSNVTILNAWYSKYCGPNQMMVVVRGSTNHKDANGNALQCAYGYTVTRPDNSLFALELQPLYQYAIAHTAFPWPWMVAPYNSNVLDSAGLTDQVDFSQADPAWASLRDASGSINAAYAIPAGVKVNNAGVSSGFLDDYWLPLLVPKSPHEFMVRVPIGSLSKEAGPSVNGGNISLFTLISPDIVGAVPISWYQGYAARATAAKATNLEAVITAAAKLNEYQGKTITFVQYDKALFLDEELVHKTTLAMDYKKAKEKACEANDFDQQFFSANLTYGTLNTKVNGSRSTKVFYGYRDAGELNFVSLVEVVDYTGWVFTGGTTTVTSKKPDGSTGTAVQKDNAEVLVQALNAGAVLVGTTLAAQVTLWGLALDDIADRAVGYSSMQNTLNASSVMGSGNGDYDFRWGSVGVTGYPDVRTMRLQEAYKATMLSKGVIEPLGAHLKSLLLEDIGNKRLLLLLPGAKV